MAVVKTFVMERRVHESKEMRSGKGKHVSLDAFMIAFSYTVLCDHKLWGIRTPARLSYFDEFHAEKRPYAQMRETEYTFIEKLLILDGVQD